MSEPTDWMAKAACRPGQGVDPELFFPRRDDLAGAQRQPSQAEPRRNPPGPRQAKAVCAGCPVIGDCEAFGLADPGLVGVWGGLSESERRTRRSGDRHGDPRCYANGCHCPACLAAHDREARRRLDRRTGLVPCPPERHGTETGFAGYGCECPACLVGHQQYLAGVRAQRRAERDAPRWHH